MVTTIVALVPVRPRRKISVIIKGRFKLPVTLQCPVPGLRWMILLILGLMIILNVSSPPDTSEGIPLNSLVIIIFVF